MAGRPLRRRRPPALPSSPPRGAAYACCLRVLPTRAAYDGRYLALTEEPQATSDWAVSVHPSPRREPPTEVPTGPPSHGASATEPDATVGLAPSYAPPVPPPVPPPPTTTPTTMPSDDGTASPAVVDAARAPSQPAVAALVASDARATAESAPSQPDVHGAEPPASAPAASCATCPGDGAAHGVDAGGGGEGGANAAAPAPSADVA
jgi:hypothetical protein